MLNLKQAPTLKDIQNYVADMEKERGFEKQTVLQQSLLLGEEVGELFKAIRKHQKMPMDATANPVSSAHEMADILIMLCSIANRLGIDIETALREKEERNKSRQWSPSAL